MTATAAPPEAQDLRTVISMRIPLAELHESPLNPRQHYDPAALDELASSLLQTGQLTPIIVRSMPADRSRPAGLRTNGQYEIAAGHRRYRAAKIAVERSPQGAKHRGLTELIAIVRELDDRAFIEVLNVENLQRDDLHPLEEAQGFRDLMEKAGYDVAKIAARCGRSEKYVYDRLKLLQLVPEAKKLFLAGEFEAGHAIILARLKPADQKRAIGSDRSGNGHIGGLFYPEYFHAHPELPAQEQLRLEDKVKPVSVREFQTWVDDNVRMRPEDVDPVLFPETAGLLARAKTDEIKVVHITYDYRVPDAARDEKQRTYGEQAWKRADGKYNSKPCAHAIVGIVVAGPGQGEAFRVCVSKEKCKTHWAKEQAELARRRKQGATGNKSTTRGESSYAAQERQWQELRAREEAERARWKKALPELRSQLAAKIKSASAGSAGALAKLLFSAVSDSLGGVGAAVKDLVPVGFSPEDVVRRAAWIAILNNLNEYRVQHELGIFKTFGLDAMQIRDEVAPSPAPEKKAVKAKKKGAK